MADPDVPNQILEELRNYFRKVEMVRTGEGGGLADHFRKLDALGRSLPPDADPRLRHYMTQKSYEKAFHLLNGRSDLNQDGSCTRK